MKVPYKPRQGVAFYRALRLRPSFSPSLSILWFSFSRLSSFYILCYLCFSLVVVVPSFSLVLLIFVSFSLAVSLCLSFSLVFYIFVSLYLLFSLFIVCFLSLSLSLPILSIWEFPKIGDPNIVP